MFQEGSTVSGGAGRHGLRIGFGNLTVPDDPEDLSPWVVGPRASLVRLEDKWQEKET